MEAVLAGLQWKICLIYLHDVITFGKSFDDAMANLQLILERLQNTGLKLKPKKCNIFEKSVSRLGHVMKDEGIAADPEKVKV